MTNEEYCRSADAGAPRSPMVGNMLRAFVCGGLICFLWQALIYLFMSMDMSREDAQARPR